MAVTFGSSLQVALFVAPVLVLLGVVIGQPMDLVFTPLEIAAVAAAVGISALIAIDGETNWLEGALLMLVYAILAVSFFEFVPAARSSDRCGDGAEGERAAAAGSFAGQAATPVGGLVLGLVLVVVACPARTPARRSVRSAGASPSASAWAASESAACSAS